MKHQDLSFKDLLALEAKYGELLASSGVTHCLLPEDVKYRILTS